MYRIILFSAILILATTGKLTAQEMDTTRCKPCLDLYNSGYKTEARKCYADSGKLESALYNAALISRELNDEAAFKTYANTLNSKKTRTALSVSFYARLHPIQSKEYLKAVNKGLKLFPNDTLLLSNKVNYFLRQKDNKHLVKTLDQLIACKKKGLSTLYFIRGTAYDKLQDTLNAISNYKLALAENPEYFDAIYNIACVYYNRSVEYFQEAEEVPFDKISQYNLLIEKMVDELRKSLPWLERAYELEPENEYVIRGLKVVYARLNMPEKLKEIKSKTNE